MGRVTINMIAEKAGVSRGTVDRVLNNRSYVRQDVRERVLAAIRETGYVSPRQMHVREYEEEKLESAGIHPLRLGVLLPNWGFGQQFLEGVRRGIEEARAELEDAMVEIDVRQCRTDLPAEAVDLLRALQAGGAQGIAVCAVRDASIESELCRMKERGVAAATFNTDLPDSGREIFIGQDIRQSGRLAAQLMRGFLRPGDQILVALGNRKFDGHRLRLDGFAERLAELGFPEEDLFTEETFNDYGTTLRVVSQAIRAHPRLRGIYMANLSVTACAEALRAYNLAGRVHVVAHDINDGIRQLMYEGLVDFTIPQDFVFQGREPLLWLTGFLRKRPRPGAEELADLQVVCAENM